FQNALSRNPLRFDGDTGFGARILKGAISGVMRTEFGIKIAKNADTNSVRHAVILPETYGQTFALDCGGVDR
ncbi:MAG: hypothetical protein QOD84_156, partial [Acidobacteriaceae bacterium]